MKSNTLAKRYAKAIFSLATENGSQDKVLNDLRALADAFDSDSTIRAFFQSPMVTPAQKLASVNQAL